MSGVVLTGLDGSNPLAFFAALGAFRAVSERFPKARLSWRDEGVWRPVIHDGPSDAEGLLERLAEDQAARATDPALQLVYEGQRDLKPPPELYREFLKGLVDGASAAARGSVDWVAAFATDTALLGNGGIKPTAFHFTAGQQAWLDMVLELATKVTREDLAEAVFGPWSYNRPLPVLGWDATSSRDYALRAANPSHDKKTGVPGADWLAARGLAFMTVVPRGSRILTTGCRGEWKSETFTWALWSPQLGPAAIQTLLRLARLSDLGERERAALGLATVFQCTIRRSDQGGYGAFTPAAVI